MAWRRRIGLLLLAVLCVVVGAVVVRVGPLVRDDLALDRVVIAVALDWRDFGVDTARQRLQYELDHQGIGTHIKDEDCSLVVEEDEVRRVGCAWRVQVGVPWSDVPLTLSFQSDARVDRHGVLLR